MFTYYGGIRPAESSSMSGWISGWKHGGFSLQHSVFLPRGGAVPASRCAGTSSPGCTVWEAKAPAHTCRRAPCRSPWVLRPDRRNGHGGGLNAGAAWGTQGECCSSTTFYTVSKFHNMHKKAFRVQTVSLFIWSFSFIASPFAQSLTAGTRFKVGCSCDYSSKLWWSSMVPEVYIINELL